MNQKHVLDLIHDYIDGLLNDVQKKSIEEHLGQCDSCRKEFDSLRTLIEELNSLPKSVEPPAELFTEIESKLAEKELESLEVNHRQNGKVEKKVIRFIDYFNPNQAQAAWYFRAAAILTVLVGAFAVWFTLRTSPLQNNISESVKTTIESTHIESVEDSIGSIEVLENPIEGKQTDKPKKDNIGINKTDKRKLDSEDAQPRTKASTAQKSHESMRMITAATRAKDSTVVKIDSSQRAMYELAEVARSSKKIVGRITDAVTGNPLAGVNVLVVGTTRGGVTDIDGKFTIVGIPPGSYTLRASQVGYATVEMKDVIVGGYKSKPLSFGMKEGMVDISGVTVTSERQIVQSLATTSTRTDSKETSKNTPFVHSPEANTKKQPSMSYFPEINSIGIPSLPPVSIRPYQYTPRAFHTEEYDKINENEFLDARLNPLSTFSIDVDNASYSNVRRFIQNGQLPPKDAVRIEELINYFTYDYPQPRDGHPFSITTEIAKCPWNDENKLLLIGLQGKKIATDNLPPSNLVFLLDVSGSMNEPNKLPLVKAAFRLLVDQLREEDKVSIVVYAGKAGLVLPSTYGDDKKEILHALDQLQAGGSTAGGEGILLAYRIAQENFKKNGNNRVILATDGDFNVGVSSDAELERIIEEKRNSGIYLSVLGFGTRNYKDSKMEKLADKGNGNYSYIDNLQEARKVFVGQMAGTLFTIAKDVKLQIEFNPSKVKAYRLIGYENRMLAKEDFNNDKKDAGELGAGHSVTALYEIIPSGGEVDLPEVDDLKYQDSRVNRNAKTSNEILTVKFRYKRPKESESRLIVHPLEDETTELYETTDNFRWAASVAEFGMLLRDSQFKGSSSFRNVLELAHDARGKDREGYRGEFIQLVELCKDLARSQR